MSVCSYLNAGLTTARINLIFGIHNHIGSDCAIGYMILTFEVNKGNFRSNKFLWQVPLTFFPRTTIPFTPHYDTIFTPSIFLSLIMLFENPGAVALLFENPGAVALL